MIGVAVGSQILKIVDGEAAVREVPYNTDGWEDVVATASANGKSVLLAGNRRWSETLAYALTSANISVFYLGKVEGGRINLAGILKKALAKGFSGRPFFSPKKKEEVTHQPEADHPWVQLAHTYDKTNDDLRRAKHRVLDALRVLFPELLTLKDKLWNNGCRTALAIREWGYFLINHDLDYTQSLGRFVPAERQAEAIAWLNDALSSLDEASARKEEAKANVIAAAGNHPAVQAYNNSFSAMMVILLTHWRPWGNSNAHGWRWLRSYAGLAVTRIDGKGKQRISRIRPLIRVNLFHLIGSTLGKEVIAAAALRTTKEKMRRVEKLEHILKDIWKRSLAPPTQP